ncbi:hypothetical protein ACROYT_G033665 [Oculina patagonica]
MCAREDVCKSAIFISKGGECSLYRETRQMHPDRLLKKEGSFYLEKVASAENPILLGTTQSSAVPSCKTLLDQSSARSSGVYWIDPDDPAVDVPISTTPPLNETDYNALNFSQWKQFGRQVLIKSNINNWLICHTGTGSLVDWQEGSVSCQIIKRVTDTCNDTLAPYRFTPSQGYGPKFYSSSYGGSAYYYFDSFTSNHWPTHDPCGTTLKNQLKNVANPHGNIFIQA